MLSDITFPTEVITYNGGAFTVRGLSSADIGQLLLTKSALIESAFDTFMKSAKTPDAKADDLKEFGQQLCTDFPTLVAALIAVASDEPDSEAIAAKLPAPVQLEAIIAIGRLSFEDMARLKKFVQNLKQMTDSQNKSRIL